MLLVLAGALGAVLLSGAPALAGNWAVTSLDPLPDRIEPNRAYTIGFWVLQHGSHPYSGSGALDPVGLKFVADSRDGNGKTTTFPGVALPEPAHYAAAIILPAGSYQVFGVQGPFQDYRVGTLTVPGGLATLAVPPPLEVGADQQPWGAIRPPQVPVDPNRNPFGDPGAAPGAERVPAPQTSAPQTSAAAAADPVGGGHSGTLVTVIVTAIATVAVVGAAGSALIRRRPRHPTPRRELIG